MHEKLLSAGEPDPLEVVREKGCSPLVLACDHAGRLVPLCLGRLGLPDAAFDRHIAWDIGVAEVSRRIAARLDAPLVAQRYSRLVIDCNRPPAADSSIPAISEITEVPGNVDLAPAERDRRRREIFEPYHARLDALLDRRTAAGQATALVAMHSFTPVFHGASRPWHIGTLYGRDGRLARALGAALAREGRYVVGDNQPYAVSDETDYTIPVHGERRGLVHVGIEIRQDLIADEAGQAEWSDVLVRCLPAALAEALGATT